MFKRVMMLSAVFVVLTIAVMAQQTFEGEVDVKVTNSRGETNDLKLYARPDAFRLEAEEGEDVEHGNIMVKQDSIFILMPSEKRYIQMPINVNRKVQDYSNRADNLRKTGETKNILDYLAEKWVYNENGVSVEIWSTKELGNIVDVTRFLPDIAAEGWYKDVFSEGFFPLSITVTNENRNTVNKIEVTEVEQKDLDDEAFELPEEFVKMDVKRK